MYTVACIDNEKLIGAIPLEIEEGWSLCGIEGNEAFFENPEGKTRIYKLPMYDKAPCVIENLYIQTNTELELPFKIIRNKQQGTHCTELSIVYQGSMYWLMVEAKNLN